MFSLSGWENSVVIYRNRVIKRRSDFFYCYYRRDDEFGLLVKVVLFFILNNNCFYGKVFYFGFEILKINVVL